MSISNFPESLSQAILAGIIVVGRLGAMRLAGSDGQPGRAAAQQTSQALASPTSRGRTSCRALRPSLVAAGADHKLHRPQIFRELHFHETPQRERVAAFVSGEQLMLLLLPLFILLLSCRCQAQVS